MRIQTFLPKTNRRLLLVVVMFLAAGLVFLGSFGLRDAYYAKAWGGVGASLICYLLAAGLWMLHPWARGFIVFVLWLSLGLSLMGPILGGFYHDRPGPPPSLEEMYAQIAPRIAIIIFVLHVLGKYKMEFRRWGSPEPENAAAVPQAMPASASRWSMWTIGGMAAVGIVVVMVLKVFLTTDREHRLRELVGYELKAALPWKQVVEGYARENGKLPGNVSDLRKGAVPVQTSDTVVSLGANGVLTLTFPPRLGDLAGKTVVFRPRTDPATGALRWLCGPGSAEERMLPGSCRNH